MSQAQRTRLVDVKLSFRVHQMSAHCTIVDPVTLMSSKTVLAFKQDALKAYSGLSAF